MPFCCIRYTAWLHQWGNNKSRPQRRKVQFKAFQAPYCKPSCLATDAAQSSMMELGDANTTHVTRNFVIGTFAKGQPLGTVVKYRLGTKMLKSR